jgi:hypothetical protein
LSDFWRKKEVIGELTLTIELTRAAEATTAMIEETFMLEIVVEWMSSKPRLEAQEWGVDDERSGKCQAGGLCKWKIADCELDGWSILTG